MRRILIFLFIILFGIFLTAGNIRADELDDIQKQINDLQKQLDLSKNATSNLEVQVKSMDTEVSALSARLDAVGRDLTQNEKDLANKKAILAATVRNFYIRSFINIPFSPSFLWK